MENNGEFKNDILDWNVGDVYSNIICLEGLIGELKKEKEEEDKEFYKQKNPIKG